MMTRALNVCLSTGLTVGVLTVPVLAQQRLVRFDGGIGVMPARVVNVQGVLTPALNVVQGVNPAGQPWVIADLTADVRMDGRIRVDGRGLLLAGGNNIGTTGNQSVRARLFCGGVAQPDTTAVPLDAAGDFRIDETLASVPPDPCANPVLLVLNGGGTVWFAAGIPKQ